MLLAVPIVAALKVVVLHVWDTRSQWPPRPTAGTLAARAADSAPAQPAQAPPAKPMAVVPPQPSRSASSLD